MKKLTTIILITLLTSSCSYSYMKYGTYLNVEPKYRAKNNEAVAMNYKTTFSCSGGGTVSYCSNKPMLEKIDEIFKEYNLTPIVAKRDDYNSPTLEVYDKTGGFVDTISLFSSIFTVGIIPYRNKNEFEVTLSYNDYKLSNKEYITTWTGWFMIPFANNVGNSNDQSEILNGLLRTTLNQLIKEDNKLKISAEDISNKPKKLINRRENSDTRR